MDILNTKWEEEERNVDFKLGNCISFQVVIITITGVAGFLFLGKAWNKTMTYGTWHFFFTFFFFLFFSSLILLARSYCRSEWIKWFLKKVQNNMRVIHTVSGPKLFHLLIYAISGWNLLQLTFCGNDFNHFQYTNTA